MTNSQIINLRAGDYVNHVLNGRTHSYEIEAVYWVRQCTNEASPEFRHFSASVRARYLGSDLTFEGTISSDEKIESRGYKTHDANGDRVSGYQLVGHNACRDEANAQSV